MGSSAVPIEKPRRANQLVETLKGQIVQGQWPVGSWMPTTRRLAEQFGVSRKTIQDALKILEAQKLVGMRSRQGCFVQSTGARPAVKKNQVGLVAPGGRSMFGSHYSVIGHDSSSWGHQIMGGVEEILLGAGKLLTMIPCCAEDEKPLDAFFERLDSVRDSLSGIVCFQGPLSLGGFPSQAFTNALDERQLPYVFINRFADSMLHNFVSVDFLAGSRLLGRCLAKMGRRRVLILGSSPAEFRSSIDRIGGLFQGYAMEEASTDQISLASAPNVRMETGYELMRQYLRDHQPPEAVVAGGDLLALGAIKALQEHGVRVPEDCGVIGSTGFPMMPDTFPLTTLAQPMLQIGRRAAQMVLEMERSEIGRITGQIVRGDLIVRKSLEIPESIRNSLSHETEAWAFKVEL